MGASNCLFRSSSKEGLVEGVESFKRFLVFWDLSKFWQAHVQSVLAVRVHDLLENRALELLENVNEDVVEIHVDLVVVSHIVLANQTFQIVEDGESMLFTLPHKVRSLLMKRGHSMDNCAIGFK